eukprot:TRINITY_DN53409_c0_g1_i2.p1 TRINITY_DN53409_c0_g1~~TRINITY_DN53409_c0_g1_i2.p1  ORF type:complete len:150 (+),score=31.60 TRINITY_DN53409_c0_g1_i2:116-565(+)
MAATLLGDSGDLLSFLGEEAAPETAPSVVEEHAGTASAEAQPGVVSPDAGGDALPPPKPKAARSSQATSDALGNEQEQPPGASIAASPPVDGEALPVAAAAAAAAVEAVSSELGAYLPPLPESRAASAPDNQQVLVSCMLYWVFLDAFS